MGRAPESALTLAPPGGRDGVVEAGRRRLRLRPILTTTTTASRSRSFATGMMKFFGGGTAVEYGVMGIGGGFWLLCSAITIYIRAKV